MTKNLAEVLLAWTLAAAPAFGQTDQTVPVKKGMRLDVNQLGGEIVVKAWEKDAVRIKAEHSRSDIVKIDALETVVRVRTGASRGRPHAVDFDITVPAWLPLTLGGPYADVTVEGAQGDVIVETNHGDITVRGGSGFVSLKTVHGMAVLEGAKGRSEVRSVNEAVRLVGVSGDTYVETTNGRITLEKMDAKNVEASTVNDDIIYDGALHRDGVYRLSTHNGNILMGVAEGVNATVHVRTFNGGFGTTVQGKVEELRKDRRYVVTFGSGGARVDLESFGGSIRLRKPEEIRTRITPRQRQRQGFGYGSGHGFGAGWGARDLVKDLDPDPNPDPQPDPKPKPKPKG